MLNSTPRLYLLFLLISCLGSAQSVDELKPYFSALIVDDIEVSKAWYTQNLGFEIVNESSLPERGIKQVNLKSGFGLIELIEISSSKKASELTDQKARIQGIFKIGFQVRDLDEWVKKLRENKVSFSGNIVEDPNTNKRMVIILDPDGNRIQLFEE